MVVKRKAHIGLRLVEMPNFCYVPVAKWLNIKKSLCGIMCKLSALQDKLFICFATPCTLPNLCVCLLCSEVSEVLFLTHRVDIIEEHDHHQPPGCIGKSFSATPF